MRPPGATFAVSNTGPLISAFQSNSTGLLTQIVSEIHVPVACVEELSAHGWDTEVKAAARSLRVVRPRTKELQRAWTVAEQIAVQHSTHDPAPRSHFPEAQAIVLACRAEYRNDLLLLDEIAARTVARRMGLHVSGFPGLLLVSVQIGLISADDLRTRLETCREQGTHYSADFIRAVFEMAKGGSGSP